MNQNAFMKYKLPVFWDTSYRDLDYIQEQFNWEKTTNETIDITNDITTLQAIEILEPVIHRGV